MWQNNSNACHMLQEVQFGEYSATLKQVKKKMITQQFLLFKSLATSATLGEDHEEFSRLQLAILLDEMEMARKVVVEGEYSDVSIRHRELYLLPMLSGAFHIPHCMFGVIMTL